MFVKFTVRAKVKLGNVCLNSFTATLVHRNKFKEQVDLHEVSIIIKHYLLKLGVKQMMVQLDNNLRLNIF